MIVTAIKYNPVLKRLVVTYANGTTATYKGELAKQMYLKLVNR